MSDYKIEVKPWMLKKSSDTFTFMRDRNNDTPMPLMVMYGTKIGEAPKMIKVKLHGDIRERIITRCMCCGRPITNKVSQYFGIGPICGEHNYTNPFDTEEELNEAVSSYRNKLINTTWVGWIPYSALVSIDDDIDVIEKSKEMPFEVVPESEYLFGGKSGDFSDRRPVIKARIDKPIKGTDDYSVFLSFRYSEEAKDAVKSLRVHIWDNDTKEWEIEYKEFDSLQKTLPNFKFEINNSEILPKKVEVSDDFDFKTKPMAHQIEGVQYGLNHNRWLLADDQGLGKALSLDTKIYTPNGYKLMRDIEVGDYVFGKDGKPTKVTAVYNHHNVEMYRITFSDGVNIECCKDHLWEIHDPHGTKVVDTKWFLQKDQFGTVRKDKLFSCGSYKYWIDRCDPVQFMSQPITLHPYILGALLGDGSLSGNSVGFTTIDTEIVNYINSYLPTGYILNSSSSMEDISYNIVSHGTSNKITRNIVKQTLKQLGLMGTNSHTKFVPDVYKYNSVDVRKFVLCGLLDTDGWADSSNLIQYTTVSYQLANDVRFLVESLGGMVHISSKPCKYNNKITGLAYTLTIRLNNPQEYFMLSRKRNLLHSRKFKPRRNIIKIERIANANAKCISVDNSDHLYLVDHFVVTHNTKQIIDLSVIRKETEGIKHCLIVCGVNSLKWNWLEEIEKHSNETGYIIGSYVSKRTGKILIGSNADKLADLEKLGNGGEIDSHYFIITNIESLRDTKIASKLKELCDNDTIGIVAVDEIHRAKRLTTQQGQGMLQLQPTYRVGMTGTPLMNSPLDLFAILKWLGYQRYGFISFRDHFCIRDEWGAVVGYKNIDQLEGQLDSIMLRRTKDKVLDLPDKVYVNEYVDLTSDQKKLYNDTISDAVASSESDNKDCILATLLRLRQVSGGIGPYNFIKSNPKLDRLEQIVEEAVYSNTKVIVYSNWVEGIKPALERLQKYNPVVITGETADADRQTLVNKFQTDDTCKVILGTIGALGTGVTLTAATEVVFLDEPWNNATKEQACDRAYRIGTTSKVTIHTIISHGTYDEDVHNIILGKKDLSDAIVDKDALAKMRIA